MKRIFILLFLLLLFNRCEDIITDNQLEYDIVVNLILHPDSSKQKALLTYAEKIDGKSTNSHFISNVTLIDNAVFFVNDIKFKSIPADSIKNNLMCNSNIHEIKDCFNYFSLTQTIIIEDLNNLKIEVNNKTITGKTIIPGDFSITLASKNLSWSSSSNAALYRVSAIYQGEYVQPFEKITKDTSITLDIEDFSPGLYKIKVEAIDNNFYNFSINKDFHAGLENAYGVFGSVRTKQLLQIIN